MRTRNARTDEHGRAFKGSQRQIQIYVNRYADELSQSMIDALPTLKALNPRLRWASPLEHECFVEYYDQGFLRAIEHPELTDKLSKFWPSPGAHWDALATVEFGSGPASKGVVIVEAKSYRLEIFGNGCGAREPNRTLIGQSMERTRSWLGVPDDIEDWKWTGPLYQYANRLAHLYFLRQAGIPSWLVNIYFVDDDSERPAGYSEWQELLVEAKDELGLTLIDLLHFGAGDLFLEAKQ